MWDVDFTGIGVQAVTLLAGALTAENEGQVVKVASAKTAGLCAAEDVCFGVLRKYDEGGGVVVVDHKGFKEVAYSGSPAVGYTELVADGNGGVKPPAAAGTGKFYHVVDIDASAGVLVLDLG